MLALQGGENIRWRPLGDCLVVHGFDPIAKVVKDLTEANVGRPNRHYHWMALGNADGQQAFYFNPANPTQARCIALTVIPCHPPVRVFTHPAYKKMLPGQWIA